MTVTGSLAGDLEEAGKYVVNKDRNKVVVRRFVCLMASYVIVRK